MVYDDELEMDLYWRLIGFWGPITWVLSVMFKTVIIGWWRLTFGPICEWTKRDDVAHSACWPPITHIWIYVYALLPTKLNMDPFIYIYISNLPILFDYSILDEARLVGQRNVACSINNWKILENFLKFLYDVELFFEVQKLLARSIKISISFNYSLLLEFFVNSC